MWMKTRVEVMRNNDVELLDFAMQWLRYSIFHDRNMKIKPSVDAARRPAAASAEQEHLWLKMAARF